MPSWMPRVSCEATRNGGGREKASLGDTPFGSPRVDNQIEWSSLPARFFQTQESLFRRFEK
jgi:hypothetical protein